MGLPRLEGKEHDTPRVLKASNRSGIVSRVERGLTDNKGGALSRPAGLLRRLLFSDYFVLYLTVIYVLVLLPFVPEIVNLTNLRDIFLQILPLFIAAMGVMLVLMVAQIDLSATSIMAMACVVGASVMSAQGGYLAGSAWAPLLAALACIAVGLVIGVLNGVCTTLFEIPSFLVTLTTMMFFSGSAIWYTAVHTDSGSSIGSLPLCLSCIGLWHRLRHPLCGDRHARARYRRPPRADALGLRRAGCSPSASIRRRRQFPACRCGG